MRHAIGGEGECRIAVLTGEASVAELFAALHGGARSFCDLPFLILGARARAASSCRRFNDDL